MRSIRSVAIINPLADFGINQYSHELAEALGEIGIRTAFYTGSANALPYPRNHRCISGLGSFLLKHGHWSVAAPPLSGPDPACARPGVDWVSEAMLRKAATRSLESWQPPRSAWRSRLLTAELALHLRLRGFDAVVTQWPVMDCYRNFWTACRRLGLFLAHTVHNVVPHETGSRDLGQPEAYERSNLLVVTSEWGRREMGLLHPELADKVVVSRIGMYTMYPRFPDARDRVRRQLRVDPGEPLILFCGAIRPYKNLDGVLDAMQSESLRRATLVVAGVESHYPDLIPDDPVGRARHRANDLGIGPRVRLIPRHTTNPELAELLEASDIVALPYLKEYASGSAVLLLAMSFGKFVVATNTSGFDEYLAQYPRSILLADTSRGSIASALAAAMERVSSGFTETPLIEDLQWTAIARKLVSDLELERARSWRFHRDDRAAGMLSSKCN